MLSTAKACGAIEDKSKAAIVASVVTVLLFEAASEDALLGSSSFLRIAVACVVLLVLEGNGKLTNNLLVLGVGGEIRIWEPKKFEVSNGLLIEEAMALVSNFSVFSSVSPSL